MSWRPEGWENPYKYSNSSAAIYFEAGADVMLEVLKEKGRRVIHLQHEEKRGIIHTTEVIVWEVFIPEERKP